MLQVICYTSHVLCCMSYVINALHSVLSSSKYISHVNLSHVTCHILHVTCHMTHFTCHMLHVTCHTLHVLGNAMHACMLLWVHSSCVTFQPVTCHMSRVTCHMSLVTCHMSQVMCHMSYFTCSWTCYALFRVHDVGQIKWPYIGLPDSPKGQRSKNDPARCQGLTLKTKTNYEFLYIKKSGTTLKSLGNRGCDIWQ